MRKFIGRSLKTISKYCLCERHHHLSVNHNNSNLVHVPKQKNGFLLNLCSQKHHKIFVNSNLHISTNKYTIIT